MNADKTGSLIRDLRTQKGMTQQELADTLNVSPTTISKWENGHSLPDISMLEPLADALNVSISEIIIGEAAMKQSTDSSTDLDKSTFETTDDAVKSVIEESIIQRQKSNLTIIKITAVLFAVVAFIVLTVKVLNTNYDIIIECILIFLCLVLIAVCSLIQVVRLEVNKHPKTSSKLMIIAVPLIAALMLMAIIGNSLFPMARAIVVPFNSDVTSITISGEYGTSEVEAEQMDIERICAFVTEAKPTCIQSYDDNPSVRPYYKIEMHVSEGSYRYFIYREGMKVYIEIPYEGIYKSSDQALEYIVNIYLKKSGAAN